MRRLEFLITQVRNSTDNKDTNGISNSEIVGYFNDAQRYITSLIFKVNPYADLFKSQIEFDADPTGEYQLPSDCFSTNAISMVEGRFAETENNKGYTRIKPVSESEFSYIFGYMTRDNKVSISGQNSIANLEKIRITYFKQLPTLDIRQAKVQAVSSGVSILLSSTPTDLYVMDDHCSAVDAQGDQQVSNIYFTNISGSALDYVKQRIYTRNNYEDANKQNYFTEQQKQDIISIFSKNKKDDDTIPITDVSFLFF